MRNRNQTADPDRIETSNTRHKGESQPSKQKGAESVSNKEKHQKDNSDGAKRNTTKKQSNSI